MHGRFPLMGGASGDLEVMREHDTHNKFCFEKMEPKGFKMESKETISMEPLGSRSERTDLQKHALLNRVEQIMKKGGSRHMMWDLLFLIKIIIFYLKFIKQRSPQNIDLMPRWYQNGTQIDAQTHQKLMPKLVPPKNHEHHQKSCFSEW